MAIKRKKQREKSRYRWAVICILAATIVIVALDVFCILMTSCPELLQQWFSLPETALAVSREDGFLSSGLSLIGLAISVWATLNIINVLDKKEVADLRSQLARIKEENENYTQEQYYNILFNEFERCSADSAMKYLAQKMRNMDNLPYAQLALAMQYYTRVYELNKIDNASPLMDEATDEGIYYIEQLLKQDVMRSNKTVEMFLRYCLGEFHFYKMYCHQGRQRYENAARAATEYTRSFKLFNTRIPEFTTEAMESYPAMKYSKAPEAKAIAAYLCNAYGECHSEMVQGIKKDKNLWSREDAKRKLAEFRDKAIFYCSYAVHWTDNSNQAYLRNLGCALEAAYGSEVYDDPIGDKMYEVYQNAMDACVNKKVEKMRALFSMSKTLMVSFGLLAVCAMLSLLLFAIIVIWIQISGVAEFGNAKIEYMYILKNIVLVVAFISLSVIFYYRTKRVMKNFLLILLGTYDALLRTNEVKRNKRVKVSVKKKLKKEKVLATIPKEY